MSLQAHLETGLTHVCRCWALRRRDGVEMGFTDHDRELMFDGIRFRADTGLSARTLQQGTGFSVDNSEVIGALSDAAIREADIEAGRYDGAELRAWLVNWQDARARQLLFRGSLGELRRSGGRFEAELRGLTDLLNQPQGRSYQKPCSAVLGDAACQVDLMAPGYFHEGIAGEVQGRRVFHLAGLQGFDSGWFRHGVLEMLSGVAAGLTGIIKRDREKPGVIELWQPLRAGVTAGDRLRLMAGCDKRMETCRLKFLNIVNFQGFPDLPGDDWTITSPGKSGALDGGSRR